ncbi:glutathione S-transferase family protein [Paracoccus sp. P2]|uniref:Glutathione S-transferase n=1 Tax=Paracoccus pantotrophus TaxID=82367 RepID=A0AAE6TV68_PARPN|nr:glutathione S-transferase family protein [Paracoccus pantotrophus]MDF3854605.1 glutathione S-transferase family protein [Paracoccus pantotrophus]QFG38082.1 glutathione S-transferase family protein [Paracoccus pantotrophus]RDE00776.1 glutathione S-transferase family protein [Paracoccus pantotrophus]RKS51420.1 glutathione S-transferase [Paracoccus pantotrophus]RNI20145.1 glutathione S-transferase family protein [Paracoccus pantotrophus]
MNTSSPSSTIRLYHVALSPFCRKVRLVLAEKRIEVELVEDRFWEPGSEIMRRNPAGKLPVLRMDGRLLAESQAICEYLDEIQPQPSLMPALPAERYEVRRLCAWFDDKFNAEVTRPVMNERVWKKVMRLGYPDSRTVKAGLSAIRYHLDYMKSLLEHRRWLAGDVMTLADFAAAAHLSCLDYISDVDWTHSAEVQEWYAKIKSRPAFRSLLADHLPGVHPAPHYALLDF